MALSHTLIWILKTAAAIKATPEDLVKLKYRKSDQPETKAKTFRKYLIRLERQGLLIQENGRWHLSPKGREYVASI